MKHQNLHTIKDHVEAVDYLHECIGEVNHSMSNGDPSKIDHLNELRAEVDFIKQCLRDTHQVDLDHPW